jgi:hypothetical protein
MPDAQIQEVLKHERDHRSGDVMYTKMPKKQQDKMGALHGIPSGFPEPGRLWQLTLFAVF